MTPLDEARLAFRNLARLVRRQDAEAARRAFGWKLMDRSTNRELLARLARKLADLEATQPDGAGIRSHEQTPKPDA